jgi:hypothetical protein
MEPSPEPAPSNPNPREITPSALPPDIPLHINALRPTFPEPDPIRAGPRDYFPDKEQFGSYTGQLREGLQTLVQGPLDYRLTSFLNSWDDPGQSVQQRDADTAARLVTAVLDAGPRTTNQKNPTPLGAEDWGTLASACLAAIARGFTRPLAEVTRKAYAAYWEGVGDNPQHILDDGENPEFHSLLQRLKATTQHLDIHINADEAEGMCKWTTTVRKEIEEAARRSASADVEVALHNWKIDQLTIRQKQLEEDINKTILERNVDLLRNTASRLGLSIGNPATTLHSRPIPLTGSKRTVSGSAPQPARTAMITPLPSIPDVTLPQTPPLDIVTLTAAMQTAMQPFIARLAAIESAAAAKNKTGTDAPTSQPNRVQPAELARPVIGHAAPDRSHQTTEQPLPDEAWTQATSKRKRRKTGKPDQANPTPQQINLTPRSYASATATTQAPNKAPTQNQLIPLANPPPAFTEVTVVRHGGALDPTKEQATRIRQPDAIVREVRANMARAVAKPLPIISGRWSSGARSKGNFVFTMRGQVDFAFIQTFEHFLTGPFPGGAQLCPNQGWTKLLAHGVPVMDNEDSVFGPDDLLQEVRTMQGLRSVYFSSLPRWIKPVWQMQSSYTSLTFAFSDPDGSITKQLLKGKQALFGKQVQIERWIDKPLLVQCGRCHTLGHTASSKSCRLPPDSVKCYICGKGHLADAHDRECTKSKQHKTAGTCDCRLQCLICNKIGHHAKERVCPARDGYRSRRPRLNNKGKNVDRGPPSPLPEVPTQRPDHGDPYEGLEYIPDEEMVLDDSSNYVPQNFLPGPGLSPEEAFNKMAAIAGEKLANLGIPIPGPHTMLLEERNSQDGEASRRVMIDRQVSPAEAAESERYDLAESVSQFPSGYFHPEMPDSRRRQLAAIISAGTPEIVNQNTPGIASTSMAST